MKSGYGFRGPKYGSYGGGKNGGYYRGCQSSRGFATCLAGPFGGCSPATLGPGFP